MGLQKVNGGGKLLETVCEKDKCDGCMACFDRCSQHAIQLEDSIKAYNAVIDKKRCIDCGACQHVCQRKQSDMPFRRPIYWKEGWAEDEIIRKESSSGGLATAIELAFIEMGGVVCSCAFSDGQFSFLFAETKEQAGKFKGSKYVKSNPAGSYKKIARYLKAGRVLLFVGLPCQVAAVKKYIGDNERLYTIDLICHGTPSPQILELFLKEYGCSLRDLEHIWFREKTAFGLKNHQLRFTVPVVQDCYTMAFLRSLSYTENCYECKYAKLERVSDITLGDSWGSSLPLEERNKGISLVLCQTEKGKKLLGQSKVHLLDVDLDQAVENNQQLRHPSVKPKQRKLFFTLLQKRSSFRRIVFQCYPMKYLKDSIKEILFKVNNTPGGGYKLQHISYLFKNRLGAVYRIHTLLDTS